MKAELSEPKTTFLYIASQNLEDKLHSLWDSIHDIILVEQVQDLHNYIAIKSPQLLIILANTVSKELHKVLINFNHPNLTKILITETLIDSSYTQKFNFVFHANELFTHHLQEIVQLKQQQIEQYNELQVQIHQLKSQLSSATSAHTQIEILKEAIVRNVSHELKTPLLHVKSAVSLMAEDMGKDNNLIRYAENATARLEALVTNITMFGSSLDLNLGPVIVRDAVVSAHRNLQRIWQSKEHADRIMMYVDDNLPPVFSDRQGLSTILQLLLDNALKFSDDEIEVHAHQIGNEVEISVKDYGIGISDKHLNTIFDSFYQVDYSSTRRYGGTGVGLALVKILIEKHESHIDVKSQLNNGSTFAFRLKAIDFE